MLPNVRPKYDKSQSLEAFLLSLYKLLKELPPVAPQHPLHASRTLSTNGIDVPYVRPLPTEETNWKVSFEKPSEIMLAGSWVTRTAVKAKDSSPFTVDLAVEMPSVSTPLSFASHFLRASVEYISGERLPQRPSFPKTRLLPRCRRFCDSQGEVQSSL